MGVTKVTEQIHRAYSVLTNKSFTEDDDFVYIEGIATTPTPDRMGDIVEPMGAQFKTPMPLLMQHKHGEVVGNMTFAKKFKDGIPFKGAIPKVKEAGRVKDRVDEAIHSLKYGLISAVSLGFRALKDGYEFMDGGGIRFKKWEWLELSLVTVPANSDAVLTAIKSFDRQHLAQEGAGDAGDSPASEEVATKTVSKGGYVSLKKPTRKHEILRISK